MTKEEYMRAGRMCIPVVCNGTKYERIAEVRVRFASSEERDKIHRNVGKEIVHLALVDRTGHVNNALPERVHVDPEWLAAFPGVFENGDDGT